MKLIINEDCKIDNSTVDRFYFMIMKFNLFKKIKLTSIPDVNITNNQNGKTPLYVIKKKMIVLNTDDSVNYYQQVTFQLSHELIHHILYMVEGKTKSFDFKESKAHETLATAFSLYTLIKFNWNDYFNSTAKAILLGKSMYSKYKEEIFSLLNKMISGESIDDLIFKAISEWNIERKK